MSPEIIVRSELVRPDLDHSPIRFTASIDGEDYAEATYEAARGDDHARGAREVRVSWVSYSDHSIDMARAHVAAVSAAIAAAEKDQSHES